jgi:hypothetical protein
MNDNDVHEQACFTSKLTAEEIEAMSDDEISRVINKMHGYSVEYLSVDNYVAKGPDGNTVGNFLYPAACEDDAWRRTPQLSTDANAAWSLLREASKEIKGEITYGITWNSFDGSCVTISGQDIYPKSNYPARAVCEAYLLREQGQTE